MQRLDTAAAVKSLRDHSYRVLLSYKDDRNAVKNDGLIYSLNKQNVSNNDYSSRKADLPNFNT